MNTKNQLHSGKLSELELGESLLTTVRKVEGGKYSLEVAELIVKPNAGLNLVGELNASDSRFRQTSPRRAWITGEPTDIKRLFNVDVEDLTFTENIKKQLIADLNIKNPCIRGIQMRVQVVESLTPSEWQLENPERSAKQITDREGKTVYFKKDGKFIFTSAMVVTNPKNMFIQEDERTEEVDFTTEKAIAESLVTAEEGTVKK